MPLPLIGFCVGAALLALPWPGPASLPGYLAAAGASLLPIAAILAVRLRGRRPPLLVCVGVCLGLAWSGFWHQRALDARLRDDGSPAALPVTGRILDEPSLIGLGRDGRPIRRFRALILAGSSSVPAGAQVRLTWYGGPELAKGESWRWHAVLRGPWGYANPGGFDYERWLLGVGFQGTGYVRGGQRLAAASPGPVDRLRHSLVERVRALPLDHGPLLLAQLIDETAGIDEDLWQTFRATGTVHLMVISGLQVSLAAAIGFLLGRCLVRLVPGLPLWLDARRAGCVTGSAVAAFYVALADAGLPSLRALVMSAATLVLLAGGRTARVGSALLAAFALLLLLQPLAIHQQGFWLSFGAVAILYLCLGHRHGRQGFALVLRAQLAISAAMLPMVGLIAGSVPWTSLPANLVA
ncbi:MAG TPA: ComEC/Rec2 family competence protein, partial [Pseudomonadales bacterium]